MAKIGDLNELRRSSDSVIAGVAGGIAKHFDVDPVLVRVIFAVLLFTGGSGIVLYIGLWLFVPPEDPEPSVFAKLFNLTDNEPQVRQVGIILSLAFGALSLLSVFGVGELGDFDLAWPLFWILFWAAVLHWFFAVRPRKKQQALEDGQTDTDDTSASGDLANQVGQQPTKPTPAAKPPNPLGGSQLTVGTLSVAAIALGIMIITSFLGSTVFTWANYLTVALLIIGIGLIVGSFFGNGLGLIWVGLLITLNLTLNDAALETQERETTQLVSVAQLSHEYKFGAGDFVLDLSRIPAEDLLNRELEVEAGIGQLTIIVPKDAPIEAIASIGIGEIHLFDKTQSGLDIEMNYSSPGLSTNRLQIEVESGIGQIEVIQK